MASWGGILGWHTGMPSWDAIPGYHHRMASQDASAGSGATKGSILFCFYFVFLQVLRRHPTNADKGTQASKTNANTPGRRNPHYPSATSPHIAAPLLSQSVSVSIWRASQIRSRRVTFPPQLTTQIRLAAASCAASARAKCLAAASRQQSLGPVARLGPSVRRRGTLRVLGLWVHS